MKNVKLVLGNVYVVENIFFNRGEVVSVSDELAETLAELAFEDYDPSLGRHSSIKYFEIEDVKPAKKAKADKAEAVEATEVE